MCVEVRVKLFVALRECVSVSVGVSEREWVVVNVMVAEGVTDLLADNVREAEGLNETVRVALRVGEIE